MKKRLTALFVTGILTISMCMCVFAAGTEADTDSAGNMFVSGDSVSLDGESFFAGFAAGQSVDITDSDAEGSVFAAGQEVTIKDSSVSESMFIGGNNVNIDNTQIHGNIFAAGNSVKITDGCEANAVYAAGNDITFEGETDFLALGGTNVSVNGTIDGDVTIDANNVDISDDTVITGTLTINSSTEPEISDEASIGKYEFNKVDADSNGIAKVSFGAMILKKITSGLYWIVAMAAFGMILCWLFDKHLTTAANYVKNRTAPLVLSGVIAWICIPIAALLMCISYILAPIAGMLMLAYVLLLCAGLAFAGASIGRLIFPKMNVFLAALIGIAALEVIRLIPFIGGLVGIAADMYLLGYVVQNLWLNRLRKTGGDI